MVRINLLPAEVIERRKYERYYPYVFITASILVGVVVALWLGTQFIVSQRADNLQQIEESEAALTRQAGALSIFEQQRTVLEGRQQVASTALTGRVDMGRILEEISLVLPDTVWLEALSLHQLDGVELVGYTPDLEEPSLDEGFKSVAACLVRLGSLNTLKNVWLRTAVADTEFRSFQGDTEGSAGVLSFSATAQIVVPNSVPAPPTTAGQ